MTGKFFNKKYVQNGADFLFPIFQRSVCPSTVQANKGGDANFFSVDSRTPH